MRPEGPQRLEPDGSVPASMDDDLTAWGKTIVLETLGRRSGLRRRVTIGFVEEHDGGLLVAAADNASHWASNLMADPRCQVEHRGGRGAYLALRLAGSERSAAIAALILKYGTPSERLGAGPAFRLSPSSSTE